MSRNNSAPKVPAANQAPEPAGSPLTQPAGPFAWYLLASSLWIAGMTLQSFLGSWLLVDRVGADALQTGWAGTISRLVPLAILLLGGVLSDRSNNRTYLSAMHLLIALPPLAMALAIGLSMIDTGTGYWLVVAFMASMAAIQALSDPARQAVLSRLAPTDIQRSVTLMTIVTSMVATGALTLGGAMDQLGDLPVLLLLAGLFLLGLWPVYRLPDLPAVVTTTASASGQSAVSEPWAEHPLRAFVTGCKATAENSTIRAVLACNFASSMFNAGAYAVAIPFVVRTVYGGDAADYAWSLTLVTMGSMMASIALLKLMPFTHPGRVFLGFQLSRALILLLLWADFGEHSFYLLMAFWGINMGVTSTLARSIVQEQAPAAQRGRILSLMLLSFMVAGAIGAPLLGALIGAADPLTALVPGVVISVLIFLGGRRSGLWHYPGTATGPAKS